MASIPRRQPTPDEQALEVETLKKYALRWAVLAAWHDELRARRAPLQPGGARRLEDARVRISTGCFSACEVGCALSEIEAELVSADGSLSDSSTGYWIELLAMAMRDAREAKAILGSEAIRFRYASCGVGDCACPASA
jgi:hypothetical protein